MPDVTIPAKDEKTKFYKPKQLDKDVIEFLNTRVTEMKDHRKQNLDGNVRSVEAILEECDREYQPHELQVESHRTLVSEDEGLASRYVDLGKQDSWQSKSASPDFYVKVNTALAILIDQNPEAVFMPAAKRYEANTKLAYGNWKNSWEVSGAKQQLKRFVFNMAKYGTGVWRTYPKIVKMDKKIRTEYYPEEPDKDVFEEKEIDPRVPGLQGAIEDVREGVQNWSVPPEREGKG